MRDAYVDDLSDFIRHHKLDCYELTDDELTEFLEVWRWAAWRRRTQPNSPDADVMDATTRLRMHLAHNHNVEVDYNTLLLLRQELEPLMHLRILRDVPRALLYFLHPRNLLKVLRSVRRAKRYDRLAPYIDPKSNRQGYPKLAMQYVNERPPNLLRRAYWRRIAQETYTEKRQSDFWW